MSLWYHNIRHTASFFADIAPPAAFVSFRLYSPAKTGIIHKKAPSHDGRGRWVYGGAEHRCAVYQGHWRDTGQGIGKAGDMHPAGSDRLLSPPVRGPQRHLSHRGIAGGRDRLLSGHDRRSPHQPPDPRRTHVGESAGSGRHRRAGRDLFQSGLPPAEPPHRRKLRVLRQGGGKSAAAANGKSSDGAGGAASADRAHHAGVSADQGCQPAAHAESRAAGAGRMPGTAAGRAAGQGSHGASVVLCQLRL